MSVTLQNKKKLGVGIAAVAAAAITLGAGTYAFFSSTGSDHTTTASAGTLQLNETVDGTFNLSPMAPGDAAQKNTLTLTNGGSLKGKLTFSVVVADHEDGCNEAEKAAGDTTCDEGPNGELSQKLRVKVFENGQPQPVYDGLLKDLAANVANLNASVDPQQTMTYDFEYQLPDSGNDSDNIVQGDSATVTVKATLKQS